MRLDTTKALLLALSVAFGCGEAEVVGPGGAEGAGRGDGKADSGWMGEDSYEVNVLVKGTVRAPASSSWDGLATDEDLQTKLVDLQLKFIKTTAESHGWRFNQLAQLVEVVSVTQTEAGLVMEYEAVTDMLGRFHGTLPRLEDLDPRVFPATVPVVPAGFGSSEMAACANTDDGHSVADYNFHYYFAPKKPGCAMELGQAEVEITEVFDRPTTYPEYDQLMQQLDEGMLGFRAALVPNRGDEDPLSRFAAHAKMLEKDLGLTGVDAADGSYRRYVWKQAGVGIVIDLFDPTDLPWTTSFADSFREKLGDYTLIHYNGHSSYGSQHLLDEPEAYSDAYQIISIHSCQSYAYYTRQVFRAKATPADPTGFALADVLATGMSSYPTGAPPTLRVLLESLMEGMVAIHNGTPQNAPHWELIAGRISGSTWGDILYGLAGVRTNAWRPD